MPLDTFKCLLNALDAVEKSTRADLAVVSPVVSHRKFALGTLQYVKNKCCSFLRTACNFVEDVPRQSHL